MYSSITKVLSITLFVSCFLVSSSINSSLASQAQLPKNAKVFFKNIKDGQTISTTQKVEFGIIGLKVHPAGQIIPGTGHHHLIIDGEPTPEGQVVPADDKHIHFGKGQTDHIVNLTPGEHTLTLQFANGVHLSYGPKLSQKIKVIVVAPKE